MVRRRSGESAHDLMAGFGDAGIGNAAFFPRPPNGPEVGPPAQLRLGGVLMAQGLTTPDRSLEQVDSEFPGAEAWLQWKATKRGFAKVLENQSDRLARIGASLFYRTCLAICAGNPGQCATNHSSSDSMRDRAEAGFHFESGGRLRYELIPRGLRI